MKCSFPIYYYYYFGFSRLGLSVALEPVLELALVDQADLELTEIRLPLPPSAGIKGVRHHYLAVPFLYYQSKFYIKRPIS